MPGSGSMTFKDNVAPQKGVVPDNGFTNDPSPTVILTLDPSAAAGDILTVTWSDGGQFQIALTARDISHGQVKFTAPLTGGDGTYTFTGSSSDGASYGTDNITLDTTTPSIATVVVAGNDTVSNHKDTVGFAVTGTIDGGPSMQIGDAVQVALTDRAGDLVTAAGIVDSIVSDGGGTYTAHYTVNFGPGALPLGSSHYQATVSYMNDAGVSASNVTDPFSVTCFMAGTLIRTPSGEVAVEALKAGDLVLTADGKIAPVAWLGRQTVSMIFCDPLRTRPIRIRANALGDNVPTRDLLISPDHALLIDGVLVQAGALVNGQSIVREQDVPQIFTYYHVELADHALILAENTPAETFIDNVDRLAFDNWTEHQALYPEGQTIVEMPYPRAKAYRQIPRAIRERLAWRSAALVEATGAAAQAVA